MSNQPYETKTEHFVTEHKSYTICENTGKRAYPSYASAKRAMHYQQKRNSKVQRPYLCNFGKEIHWHLTSSKESYDIDIVDEIKDRNKKKKKKVKAHRKGKRNDQMLNKLIWE